MIYEFRDIDGNSYEVNGSAITDKVAAGSFTNLSQEFTIEQKIVERSFLSGAVQVGNPRLGSRPLTFEMKFTATSDTIFDTQLNTLLYWLNKTVVVRDTTNTKETKVAAQTIGVEFDSGCYKRSGSFNIDFLMLDSFWTDVAPQTITDQVLTIGVNNIAISNTGFLLTYPKLTFTFPNPAPQVDMYINETKQGLQLIDSTLGTVSLEVLTIDCWEGTLLIATFDRTQNITDRTGYFPFPINGSTLVVDTPVAATVTIEWYLRYYS